MLPDADPDDKWDEELEEGDTILAIDFTQAILICAHHANDLAAKATKGRRPKRSKRWFQNGTGISPTYSRKRISTNSPSQGRGTTPLNSFPTQTPTLTVRSTLSIVMNRPSSTNSWTRTFQTDEFDHQSHLWRRHSSSYKKKDGKLRPIQDYRKLKRDDD